MKKLVLALVVVAILSSFASIIAYAEQDSIEIVDILGFTENFEGDTNIFGITEKSSASPVYNPSVCKTDSSIYGNVLSLGHGASDFKALLDEEIILNEDQKLSLSFNTFNSTFTNNNNKQAVYSVGIYDKDDNEPAGFSYYDLNGNVTDVRIGGTAVNGFAEFSYNQSGNNFQVTTAGKVEFEIDSSGKVAVTFSNSPLTEAKVFEGKLTGEINIKSIKLTKAAENDYVNYRSSAIDNIKAMLITNPNSLSAVRCVTSDGTVLKTITGEAASTIYYPVIVQDKDNNYYKTSATTFGKTFEKAGVDDVTYSLMENCVYYAEGEDLITDTASSEDTDNITIYSMGGNKLALKTTSDFTIPALPVGTYSITGTARANQTGNEHIYLKPDGSSNTDRADLVFYGDNGYSTVTGKMTVKSNNKVINVTANSGGRVYLDYIYIEKVPSDLTAEADYVGAYTSEGAYTFRGETFDDNGGKVNDDAATAYMASFSNPLGTVYTNPTITWTFDFNNTANEQIGTQKTITPVTADTDGTVSDTTLNYGLVVKGALIDSGDATVTAVFKNGQ